MSQLVFAAPPVVTAPVRGRSERVPIRRIFCVGRNYERTPKKWASPSIVKRRSTSPRPPSTTSPSGSTVPYPPGTSNYHYELELVVVIGAPAFRVPAHRALDCVFGYACGLDMTRRDLQFAAREQRRPWDLGKDVEQSAVLSEIVPADRDRSSRRRSD